MYFLNLDMLHGPLPNALCHFHCNLPFALGGEFSAISSWCLYIYLLLSAGCQCNCHCLLLLAFSFWRTFLHIRSLASPLGCLCFFVLYYYSLLITHRSSLPTAFCTIDCHCKLLISKLIAL